MAYGVMGLSPRGVELMYQRIEIICKSDCCGCGACEAACPLGCISMEFDEEGFKYPKVDADRCVDCGRCARACPLADGHDVEGTFPVRAAYAATNRDDAVRAKSTSGGAFDAIARVVIEDGGIVVGVRYDEGLRVVHDVASTVEEASAFYGSKYVQSDLVENDVFRRVREACEAGTPVLFSGTPCQVQGLRTYLGRDYPGLITCDFVCRAVPAPREWESYLRDMESKYHSKPIAAVFRNKTYGYHSGTMKLTFEDGREYYGSGRVDPMHKAFFADLISRPSCYECRFRRPERSSDFTIFDCWSYSRLTGCEDDDLGHTHLWLRTDKAMALLSRLKQRLDLYEVNLDEVLAGDGVMATRDISRNLDREKFLAFSREHGITAAVKKFIPVTFRDRLLERSKSLLYRFGMLDTLSKARRMRKMKKYEGAKGREIKQ